MKQQIVRLGLAAAFAMGAVMSAAAHDGHDHIVMGTVMAVDAKHLELKTPSGEILSIAISAKTSFVRDKKKVAARELQAGRRAVVNIGNGEDPLIAREIQIGASAASVPAAH